MRNYHVIFITLSIITTVFARKADPIKEVLLNTFPHGSVSLTKLSHDEHGFLYIQVYWSCKEEKIEIIPKKKRLFFTQQECGAEEYIITAATADTSLTEIVINLVIQNRDSDEIDESNIVEIRINREKRKQVFYQIASINFDQANGTFIASGDVENFETFCLDCDQEREDIRYEEIKELYQ